MKHLEGFSFIPQFQNQPHVNREMKKGVLIQARFHNIFGKIALIRLESERGWNNSLLLMLVILLINLICAVLAPAQHRAVSGFVFAPSNKALDSSPLRSPPEKTFRLNAVFFCLCQSFHCLLSFILPLPSSPQRCNRMHLFLYFSFTDSKIKCK